MIKWEREISKKIRGAERFSYTRVMRVVTPGAAVRCDVSSRDAGKYLFR